MSFPHATSSNTPKASSVRFLERGTEDETVGHEGRAIPGRKLQSLGSRIISNITRAGSHSLLPTISKAEAFAAMFPRLLALPQNSKPNDFENGSLVSIPCGQKTLHRSIGRSEQL